MISDAGSTPARSTRGGNC